MRTALESVHLVAATIGFISFGALWAGTLWGSVLRSGWASSRLRHSTVHSIHMHLVLLGLWLGIVHGVVQVAAPLGKVRAIDVVVPFIDRADPVGIGFGVLGLELLIASGLSVLVQKKLGWHRWRALHSLGYLAFTLVAAHMLISGSETAAAPVRLLIAAAWGAVAVTGASTIAPVARLPRTLLERVARRHRAEEITVAVDAGRCASFGFCEQEAPAIFSLRSDRRLAYRSVVSSDQAEAAQRAAVVCPARAIALGRLPTAVVLAQAADEVVEPAGVEPEVPVATRLAPVFQSPAPVRKKAPEPVRRPAEPARRAPRGPAESAPVPVSAIRAAVGRPAGAPPMRGSAESAPVPVSAIRAAVGRRDEPATSPDGVPAARPRGPGDTGVRPLGPADSGIRPLGPADSGIRPLGPADSGIRPLRPSESGIRPIGPVDRGARGAGSNGVARGRGAAEDGPATGADALPPPSVMQDTGRHHLPPLRGLPGGRSGSGR